MKLSDGYHCDDTKAQETDDELESYQNQEGVMNSDASMEQEQCDKMLDLHRNISVISFNSNSTMPMDDAEVQYGTIK